MVTFVGNTPLPVECRANNNCTFQYDNSSTPTLASITPTSVSAPSTTFTITGNGFGDSISDVIVTLGGAVCSVINVISTQITCTTENVPAGSHIPQVKQFERDVLSDLIMRIIQISMQIYCRHQNALIKIKADCESLFVIVQKLAGDQM